MNQNIIKTLLLATGVASILQTANAAPLAYTADDLFLGFRSSNPRWEKFAQFVAGGESGAAAYRKTYDARGASAEANASRLLRNDKVKQRVAEMQAGSATTATLTMQQRREIAREIALDTKARNSDRLAAIMADAKLAGELKPEATVNVGVKVQPPDALIAGLAKFLCEQADAARARLPGDVRWNEARVSLTDS